MKDSFVFYKSFLEAAQEAPDAKAQHEILWQIVECCLGIKEPHDVPFPASAIVIPIMQTVTKAGERYAAAVENGKKGGRPRKWVDEANAKILYEDFGSWEKVAEELDVSRETLRKARAAWAKRDAQKPKNLTDTVTYTDTVTDTETVSSISNNKTPSQPPAGAIAPPSAPDVKKEERWIPPPLPTD